MDEEERVVTLPIEYYGLYEMNLKTDYFGTPIHLAVVDGQMKLTVKPHENYMIVRTI